ncbi:hypothetical protein JHK85_000872 [Glycine max]|nr:hypothetical protein JHK85_000872 [Glycine max]
MDFSVKLKDDPIALVEFLSKYCQWVVLTLGANGCIAKHGTKVMKGGCLAIFLTRRIVCWWAETPPASFSDLLSHILKHRLLMSRLPLLLSRPLIFHGLRPIHPFILLEILSLIEIVGKL